LDVGVMRGRDVAVEVDVEVEADGKLYVERG